MMRLRELQQHDLIIYRCSGVIRETMKPIVNPITAAT